MTQEMTLLGKLKDLAPRSLARGALIAAGMVLSLGACLGEGPDDEGIGEESLELVEKGGISIDPPCPPVPACDPTIDVAQRPSLLVTLTDPGGPTILNNFFQLEDVLDQLIAEAGVTQTATDLFQRLWDTENTDAGGFFGESYQPHCDDAGGTINGFPIDCPRQEGVLAGASPADFVPVAVFNRFDLAASDGSHCGEYRIIYAMVGGMPGRNFIIFEGQLPNPNPSCGVDSCRPVAEFWHGLEAMGTKARANALHDFYFVGLPDFGPVITPANYGFGSKGGTYGHSGGQIRTNQFGNFNRWQLREFQLDQGCSSGKELSLGGIIKAPTPTACRLIAKPVTVKDNPFGELFNTNPLDPLTVAFQADFVDSSGGPSVVERLAASSLMAIGLGTDDVYNAGQSTSQPSGGDPDIYPNELAAGGPFAADIQTELTAISSPLTPLHITRRAMTQSCAGCHQLNNGTHSNLGGGLTWPSSLGFVHVDEAGNVSPALSSTFLPHREQVLETFLRACGPAGISKSAPSSGSKTTKTLGGSSTH
ncbi:MAG: hypothetical protein KC731_38765 [Myxococcales bacterium]|nr:hypothetical protein [Myxococcales bacterium]